MSGHAGAGDSDSDDGAFIDQLRLKHSLREGTRIAVASTGKQNKTAKGSSLTGGGSFQSMGLPPALLKTLLQRGFTTPTPIQRIALPAALATPPRDIVGMARTGSGKTLAYMVPLIARLGGQHSPKFGARALILVPTRELALQVLKVGKDLARGSKSKDGEEALRWGMIVGGDSLEEQYAMIAGNPDVIIATPGRLLHLLVEMSTDLMSVQYVVFDEADRLFELGFSTALNEILSKLSPTRQTLLFSATLPKSLVEFAKAGLQNPKLVRLDSESKISSDLEMAFLSVKPKEKEAALLILLREIIKVPQVDPAAAESADARRSKFVKAGKKRKRDDGADASSGKSADDGGHEAYATSTQTIIFAATKHHVEYLSLLLANAGYSVSAIYGSLDQSARRSQLAAFRAGRTQLLVVTDLAARGIDIPILSNVVNYDFPAGSRTFVHRVGRTARAGRKGWAYSFVTNSELAYLYDLQLFLGRSLVVAPQKCDSYSENITLGTLPRDQLDLENDHFKNALLEASPTLQSLLGVAEKGQKMYERSQAKASQESHRRAKELLTGKQNRGLAGSEREVEGIHPIFGESIDTTAADMLAAVNAFRPQETVFEIGSRGKSVASLIMQKRRTTLGKKVKAGSKSKDDDDGDVSGGPLSNGDGSAAIGGDDDDGLDVGGDVSLADNAQADEAELSSVFEMRQPRSRTAQTGLPKKQPKDFRDSSVYMGYVQEGAEAERGYSLSNNDGFAAQAASAAFDLTATDENAAHSATQKASLLRWDRRHKKFVKGDGTGSDNKKLIRTESGTKLPASFKSGSFDEWKRKQKVFLPKTGEAELRDRQLPQGKKFRYQGVGAKTSNKPRKDGKGGVEKEFDNGKKGRKTKSSAHASSERNASSSSSKSTLKSVDQIRKERTAKANRVRRSNQPRKR